MPSPGGFDIAVLVLFVGGIEIDKLSLFVRLVVFDERLIFFEGEELALDILQQSKVFRFVIEVPSDFS